jgi:hypothetical protein
VEDMCRQGHHRLQPVARQHIRQLSNLMRLVSGGNAGGREPLPASQQHPQGSVFWTSATTESARAAGEKKSGGKRQRSQTDRDANREKTLAQQGKTLRPPTKEFVLFSCSICGFTIYLIMLRWQGGKCTQSVDPQNQVVVLKPIQGECFASTCRVGKGKDKYCDEEQ